MIRRLYFNVLVVLYFVISVKSNLWSHDKQERVNQENSVNAKSTPKYDKSHRPTKKVPPREDLAQKAYGEPGERWGVSGYSEKTGYPIIDLSSLGISSEASVKKPKAPETPSNNPAPTESPNKPKQRPLSYSEMKGLAKPNQPLTKRKKTTSPIKQFNTFVGAWSVYKNKNRDPKETVRSLHLKLHRTHAKRQQTVRSILYPNSNPPKYRILSKKKTLWDFFSKRRFESSGKYDFRHLDVEKLLDIVVQDAALLLFKYIRDLPAVPVIYECKVGAMFPLFKLLGHFNEIERYLGRPATTGQYPRRRFVVMSLMSRMLRWLLNIKPVKNTVHGPARHLEHDITMMQRDYSQYSERDCEGEMDERDKEAFLFHYNYLMGVERLSSERQKRDKLTAAVTSDIKSKLVGGKSDSQA